MSSFNKKFDHLKIPLRDVLIATKNFADEHVIRKDGFGKEYKGQLVLRSGELIDIVARRLDRRGWYGTKEFQTEVMMLSSLKHQNVTSIVGFCDEDNEEVIINKFEGNGRLDQYLSDTVTLTWTRRLHICLGIARALSYIHYDEGRSFSVIHRDVKSGVILLDDTWEPKLCGFELSIMQAAARRHGLVLDEACGTFGYVDPAYVKTSSVNHKSDVYSFGVVLFEVLSGRQALLKEPNETVYFSTLAKSHYENGTLNEIIHPDIKNQMDSKALKVFSEAAYWCLKEQRAQRPHIDRVIIALEKALELQLAYENSLVLKEHSVQGTSTYHWKGKDLEHLKIEFDAIKLATKNFSEEYCIGFGGYGAVYKAELEHFDPFAVKSETEGELPRRRSTVAIKRIYNTESKEGEQGFITEIETLSSCAHPNIVSLYGFCYEPPHMILVYEHVYNGSLDDYFESEGKMTKFTWVQRLKICIDIARGLDYMHTIMDHKQKIIHRDIKSANILLGKNWEAKIADFGLSKLQSLNNMKSTLNTKNVAGTQVYLDPEYERTGKLKKESDVYSFGVVLFEILSGRLAYDPVYTNKNEKGLAPIVKEHFKNGTIKDLVDPILKEESTFTLSKGPNQDSLNTFLEIGYKCLAEKQVERPKMKSVIKELENALNFQETHSDNLRISLEDVKRATQNFNNLIGMGEFWNIYRGEILHANRPTPIAVKRHKGTHGHVEKEFLTELEILFENKHKNIIGLIGYCNEHNEMILVYEYASKGSLNTHLKYASLTWTERLKIAIDVAIGLEFLHESDPPVIHRDIKSSHILLNDGWRAKITGFGLSIITSLSNEIDFMIDYAYGTHGYVDLQYVTSGFLTRESDMYSLGVVLFEMMCGRLAIVEDHEDERRYLVYLVKRYSEQGRVDKLVFEGIRDQIVAKSLTAFVKIAYQCLHDDIKKRPTASKVALQLKEALELQEDIDIWEGKLPKDYKQIVQMSKTPDKYSNVSNKDLYRVFSKGILVQNDKVCLSISSNGERNEMVSATMFSYGNKLFNKRISIQNSRFKRVVKIMNILNLNIHIKIKTQFLSPNVHYGAHLVFKFCEPRKSSANLMYVNLKYQMGSEPQHAYFATRGDDEWMMIELCRFIPHKKDVEFDVLLESLSRYYCGGGAIYVEGIHFRAINNATSKKKPEVVEKLEGVQRALESNADSVQFDEITQLENGEKSISKADDKKCHMLPAKMVLYDTSDVNRFNWKSLAESRFQDVVELLSNQILRIKCKIKAQKLSADTDYACYLVFKLSPNCHGLQCPVKVQDVLLRKNKEFKFLYLRPPRLVNVHGNGRVPKLREDGLMEVIVWEFNSVDMKPDDDQIPMSLKLRCYEGTMSGLLVYGVEFRPI